MRKYIFVSLALILGVYFLGCGKKQQTLEEMQVPMSIESLGTISTETKTAPETKIPAGPALNQEAAAPKLELLPPAGPYKPTTTEIQTALMKAGFYKGALDGKAGPMTKKAVAEFQKSVGLEADGKVGPKTWAALEQHLKAQPKAKKKR